MVYLGLCPAPPTTGWTSLVLIARTLLCLKDKLYTVNYVKCNGHFLCTVFTYALIKSGGDIGTGLGVPRITGGARGGGGDVDILYLAGLTPVLAADGMPRVTNIGG